MLPSRSAAALRETTQAKFTCEECGFSANGDGFAAMNIKEAGLAWLACGDTSPEVRGVGPRTRAFMLRQGASRNPLPSGRGGCQRAGLRVEDFAGGGIDAAERGIAGVEGGDGGGLGVDARGHANDGGAGGLHGRTQAGAHARGKFGPPGSPLVR